VGVCSPPPLTAELEKGRRLCKKKIRDDRGGEGEVRKGRKKRGEKSSGCVFITPSPRFYSLMLFGGGKGRGDKRKGKGKFGPTIRLSCGPSASQRLGEGGEGKGGKNISGKGGERRETETALISLSRLPTQMFAEEGGKKEGPEKKKKLIATLVSGRGGRIREGRGDDPISPFFTQKLSRRRKKGKKKNSTGEGKNSKLENSIL